VAGLDALGLELPEPMRAAMEAQARLLVAWSGAINLTTHRSPGAIAVEHVLDSLAAHRLVLGTDAIIDLGSGAGYPGLPLAVCLPVARAALVESIAKKARFLEAAAAAAVAELGHGDGPVPVVDVLAMRAEDLARDADHREAWDLVTARALARTDELVELALPLLRLGGRLVAWKRDDGTGALALELDAARDAIRVCGGTRPEVHGVTLPGLEDHRLVVIVKRRPTPRHLPRSPTERRRPLLR
jgi:16S rRNA (guanine527-N7)-methyltransferase